MKFGINYSKKASTLLQSGEVKIDIFKCPDWPETIAQARDILPTYAHFPFALGRGLDNVVKSPNVVDPHGGNVADWDKIEHILKNSDTTMVNVHLFQSKADYPEIPANSNQAEHVEIVIENAIRNINGLGQRFGIENVIVENATDFMESAMIQLVLPENITRIVEETGCGFLFDLSHARMAARDFGVDAKEYIQKLPLKHIREMHITGIQFLDEKWMSFFSDNGIEDSIFHKFEGMWVDHLPFVEDDWPITEWALAQIHAGTWAEPEMVTLEYGGVGGVWEVLGDESVMLEQLPRLYEMVHLSRS
jgi:uncharacterized protein